MDVLERIEDIKSVGTFRDDEIIPNEDSQNYFSSIEYHLIIHVTNEDLYYMDEETEKIWEEHSEDTEDTEKGRIYLFK